jgi:mRNA interferase MazF
VLNRVQVVPLSSNVERLYPSEAYVAVEGKQHKAMADQVATVSKPRVLRRIGALSGSDVESLERAIRIQLAL